MVIVFISFAAHASAPLQKTQAPGYYRLMVGDFEVTVLSDGSAPLSMDKALTNVAPKEVGAALEKSFLKDMVDTSVNAFLINTGSKLVLIDSGAGSSFGPTCGKLLSNLIAAGYRPEQVDEIYITHMHGDHVGGLVVNNRLAFPNAIVRASQQEADFWLSKAHKDTAPEALKGFFEGAMNSINPYISLGRFETFSGATQLVPGIFAVAAPGHTTGHTLYTVESRGQKLVLWGDLVHVAAIQFDDPSVTMRFDTDPAAAAAARKREFADASAHGYWVAGAHLAFPGIGHLRKSGAGYAFVAANYSAAP